MGEVRYALGVVRAEVAAGEPDEGFGCRCEVARLPWGGGVVEDLVIDDGEGAVGVESEF